LNDFWFGEAKIGEKIKTIKFQVLLYAICIFRNGGSGAKPQKLGNFGEFLC